jgi:SAM-dependent methyltransferase
MAGSDNAAPQVPNYGIDAPGVIRVLAIVGTVALVAGLSLARSPLRDSVRWHVAIGPSLEWMGWGMLAGATLMIASSRWGKLRARDRLLDRIRFAGDETVLDVGCGHGLLLIGAARRVPNGKAIGIDLWSQKDQKDNAAAATMENAFVEGVARRVEVRDGDMRKLPLPDASVDVVLSSLAIHNISSRDDRRQAIREIVRVLKPGGKVGILDISHVGEYAADLRAAGMRTVATHGITPWIYPPTRVLTAVK